MRYRKQIIASLLRALASERRRITSDWRTLLYCRRIAQAEAAPLPDANYTHTILREMLRSKQLVPIQGVSGVFRVDVPFADLAPVTDEHIVQEANPSAVFSHLTALACHALTDRIPNVLGVTHYTPPDPDRLPLGTTPEEWVGLPPPPWRRPRQVDTVSVQWFSTNGKWDFGHAIHYTQGLPIYVTDPERTLLDAIRSPENAGGIATVLRAWRQGQSILNLDRLIEYTERFSQSILRQRVGYLLETLGQHHPHLAQWKRHLVRGSSVKLLAAKPFAPTFAAEWNLSLNVPDAVLAELREE